MSAGALRGLVIAAPTSGAGKTVMALALMRALAGRGHRVAPAKSGPDYIDPRFHEAACGATSVNLDGWAMDRPGLMARAATRPGDLLVVEGAMGVLDGAEGGGGATADLAEALGLPVVLVLDIARQAQSAALPVAGLGTLRPDLAIAGVILNRAGSARHAGLAGAALEALGVRVFGWVPRAQGLALPSRHLGLVQAGEIPELEAVIAEAARLVAETVDLDGLAGAAMPLAASDRAPQRLPPLGQRIAVARDTAFAFAYPHLLDDWHAAGAEVVAFSPLADEAPDGTADAVFVPGGYPELHAGRIAAAAAFRAGVTAAATRGATIYGECGGYMVLGDGLIDAEGARHAMAGLLPLVTSFEHPRMTLGYRRLTPLPGAPFEGPLRGHEFHFSSAVSEGAADRLFEAADAAGRSFGAIGLRRGRVSGSYAHVIAPAPR